MFCPKCGTKLPDGSKFCGVCGARLEEKSPVIDVKGSAGQINKAEGTKKINSKIIAVAAIAVVAVIAITVVIGAMSLLGGNDAYVCLSDGRYEFFTDLKDAETIEISKAKSAEDSRNTVNFSPDGKYVYYFTDYDSYDGTGTLCRAEFGKLKADSSKNSKYIEIIDKHVFVSLDFVGDNYVIYQTENFNIYCYNGEKSVRIANDADYWWTDGSNRLIYVEETENIYESIRGINLDEPEKDILLVPEYDNLYYVGDFEKIIYTMEDKDGSETLYSVNFAGESTKIAKDVEFIFMGDDGEVFYAAESGEVILYDYVNDSGDSDYDWLRKDLKNKENAKKLYTIYSYKDGEYTIIDDSILDLDYIATGYVYNTLDSVTEKIDIEDVSSIYDVKDLLSIDTEKENMIITYDGFTYKISEEATEKITDEDWDNYEYDVYAYENEVYYIDEDETLYYAKVEEGIVGNFEIIADGIDSINKVNSEIYCAGDGYYVDYDYYCTLYRLEEGEPISLVDDVMFYSIKFFKDGSIIASGEYYEYYGCELVYVDHKGNSTIISDDVTDYVKIDEEKVLFVSDEQLFVYEKGETTKIKDDVKRVWSINEVKAIDTWWLYY